MERTSLNLRDAAAVAEVFERAAAALRQSPGREGSIVRLRAAPGMVGACSDLAAGQPSASSGAEPAGRRLLVTGDLHDNPAHLGKIIRLAKLDQSSEHHVVLHEMIHGEHLVNGLDLSHRMLARVAELVMRYPGQVHPLLANHELSQMTGKGVSKGAGNSVELFNDGLEYAYGDEAETVAEAINAFITAMPLALIAESAAGEQLSGEGQEPAGLFCAHSLPAPHMMKHFDVNVIHRELTAEDYASPFGSAHLMVWGRRQTDQQIDELARVWNVKLFCLGHERVDAGIEMKGPRLIVLNSDHARGVALPIDLTCIPSAEQALHAAIPLALVNATPLAL